MRIPLVNLAAMHTELQREIATAIDAVLTRGDYILGRDVFAFEEEFAAYLGAKHCIGVGNGLDALTLALKGLGVGHGDEVITQANTYVATALAVHHAGATPVLVDHEPDTYGIDPQGILAAITPRTKAIIPVHMYGQAADMDAVAEIATKYGLKVLEDAAQAHGTIYKGRRCGTLGDAAAFSFYPGKNLGAIGDGGAIVTNDDDVAAWLRSARNYGSTVKYRHTVKGMNTRLDTLQAAVLRVKLPFLDRWNETRRELAERYRSALADTGLVLPAQRRGGEHNYHLFVVRCATRDALLQHLHAQGIGAAIHYPVPVHQQVCFGRGCIVPDPVPYTERFADQLLSLPICPYLAHEQVDEIADAVRTALEPVSVDIATVTPAQEQVWTLATADLQRS